MMYEALQAKPVPSMFVFPCVKLWSSTTLCIKMRSEFHFLLIRPRLLINSLQTSPGWRINSSTINSLVSGHQKRPIVGMSAYVNYDNVTLQIHVGLLFMSNERTAYFPADKWRFYKPTPLFCCSIKGHSFVCIAN